MENKFWFEALTRGHQANTWSQAVNAGSLKMTLRTPRRRISPRTKRRCRAIKDFLRRALGSSSHQQIKINSSTIVNVTDIKHKVIGIEQQLNEVSKQLITQEIPRRKSEISLPQVSDPVDCADEAGKNENALPERKSLDSKTKILYKTSDALYRKSDESDYVQKVNGDIYDNKYTPPKDVVTKDSQITIVKHKHVKNRPHSKPKTSSCQHKRLGYDTRSVYDNRASVYSASSCHSLIDSMYGDRTSQIDHMPRNHRKKRRSRLYEQEKAIKIDPLKEKRYKDQVGCTMPDYIRNTDDKHTKKKKNKHNDEPIDQDFIAEIIQKQYKPMKMFGKRESDISQFSAPVCRDQEFKLRDNVMEGSQLCSCCYDIHNPNCHIGNNLSDMGSICDTKLYSSKRNARHKLHRKNMKNYNDSTLYDLVPVKEKSSPKSRRKFVEDNSIPYECAKEVPPSPRTKRPQFNLKAQYHVELNDDMIRMNKRRNKRRSRSKKRNLNDFIASMSDDSSVMEHNSPRKWEDSQQDNIRHNIGTTSSVGALRFNGEQGNRINKDNALNKSQEVYSNDKPDKALCEIKDILQNFLQEIKKESVSQCDKLDMSQKIDDKQFEQQEERTQTAETITNSAEATYGSSNSYSILQCGLPVSYDSPYFNNPCCYPVLPMYPMNCVQSGFMVSNPSYTCATCTNKDNTQEDDTNTTSNNPETEQLIKEIYNLVTQNTKPREKGNPDKNVNNKKDVDKKRFISRSVGGSTKFSKHDANVGTSRLKCLSKSCEAIGSPLDDTYNRTVPSYSDTVLDRFSLEATPPESEDLLSEIGSEIAFEKKGKKSKIASVLLSYLGLSKKKKHDTIEELPEGSSSIIEEHKPFGQNIKDYMMYERQYNHPQPSAHHSRQRSPSPQHLPGYEHLLYRNPNYTGYSDPYNSIYSSQIHHTHPPDTPYASRAQSPVYTNTFDKYNSMQPQVPLCLKEVEVKSIATQSDRKISFFKKFSKKAPVPDKPEIKEESSQEKSGFWKTLYINQLQQLQQNTQQQLQKAEAKQGFWKKLYLKQEQALLQQQKQQQQQKHQEHGPKEKPGFWKSLQMKQEEQLRQKQKTLNQDPFYFSFNTEKQLAVGDEKMRKALLKKLFYKRNPFSPRNLLVKTLMGKDPTSRGDAPMMSKPPMFF